MGKNRPGYWRDRYRSIRLNGRMTDMDACLIEAILTVSADATMRDIIDRAGYSNRDSVPSFCKIRNYALIERSRFRGYYITDKGKIALAIWRGKQRRKIQVQNVA